MNKFASKYEALVGATQVNRLVDSIMEQIKEQDSLPFQLEALATLERCKKRAKYGMIIGMLASMGVGIWATTLPVSLLAQLCIALAGGLAIGTATNKVVNTMNSKDLNTVLNGETITLSVA